MEPTGKALFVVMDGLGDRGADTPLSTANSPNLDDLAAISTTGLLHTIGDRFVPGSDTAHLALFGYDPHEYYGGRGAFEALGAGMAGNAVSAARPAGPAPSDEWQKEPGDPSNAENASPGPSGGLSGVGSG